ncbi:MAG: 4Fe-4S binding protein [Candidatus Bathyarchaeia archaeon]
MRIVNMIAKVNLDACSGCGICERVCPVNAIKMINRVPVRDEEKCMGCGLCESRCPNFAVTMVQRSELKIVKVDPRQVDQNKLVEICLNAKLHPKQIICFCTRTRAEEVAAAILKGAKSPEEVSHMTGVRTGCKVECIQPILRLLEAAKIVPKPPRGWQWYGKIMTVWDIPKEVERKYSRFGFYFNDDVRVLDKIVKSAKK